MFIRRTDVEAETPILWPPDAKSWLIGRLWWWEGLGAGGEGDDRGWDGWMASLTRWRWVWVNSRRWWWTGRPGVLRFMGSQRVRHDWATKLTYIILGSKSLPFCYLFKEVILWENSECVTVWVNWPYLLFNSYFSWVCE